LGEDDATGLALGPACPDAVQPSHVVHARGVLPQQVSDGFEQGVVAVVRLHQVPVFLQGLVHLAERARLDARPGQKVLEIGTGSGYHAAVVSRLILPGGRVYSVERVGPLVKFAQNNLEKAGIDNVTVVEGDGSVGLPEHAPFDRIYYTCAAPDVPEKVVDQLVEGGSILAVIGPKSGVQRLVLMRKTAGRLESENLTHCVFVPLIGELGY
ncbi:MAG: protein-L-isoaspartate O-methyltransferase family protein, partial [Thermoplasmatota archaeon]